MRKWLVLIIVAGLIVAATLLLKFRPEGDSFNRLMSLGGGYLEKGDATNAIATYSKAVELVPEAVDAHLNLANAYLLAGNVQKVIEQSDLVLKLDHNNAAAYYLLGCAYLRANQAEQAVQTFQQSQKIDPAVTALNFQLGLAQERAGHLEDAIQQFETVIQFEPEHPSAHYQLSRLYQRAGREAEAAQELSKHEQVRAKNPAPSNDPAVFERCKYTQPKRVVAPDEPDRQGVSVTFVDVSSNAFGEDLASYHGPVGVLDYNHDGRNSLFVMQKNGFRLLNNLNGQFKPLGDPVSTASSNTYTRCLVGDLNNDRFEDVVMLGEQAAHVFRFATNGQFREVTSAAGLKELKGRDGLLADLDFTGKLDLLAIDEKGEGLRVWRNLGNAYFRESTTNSGLPLQLPGITQVQLEDLNNEDVPGLVVSIKNRAPLFFSKKRAGSFVETNITANWPAGTVMAVADLNNDLMLDYIVADEHVLHVGYAGGKKKRNCL
jgi:tetratricopeptide (TPR) repeat protein